MEKKNKGLIIIVILLLLILTGLVVYIVYDKVLNTKENEPIKTAEKKVLKQVDLEQVAQLLTLKLEKYYVDFYDDLGNADFVSMADKDKILGAFVYGNGVNLSKSVVDDYYENLFGVKLSEYPDLNCWANDGVYAKYNASSGDYERQTIKLADGNEVDHAHGGPNKVKADFIKYNNIEKSGDNYIITVTKVFGPAQGLVESPENAFYADSKYTVKIDGLSQFAKTSDDGSPIEADIEGAKKYYEQNYDQFKNIKPQYKYTFKKDKDNYYLTNFETIK